MIETLTLIDILIWSFIAGVVGFIIGVIVGVIKRS